MLGGFCILDGVFLSYEVYASSGVCIVGGVVIFCNSGG